MKFQIQGMGHFPLNQMTGSKIVQGNCPDICRSGKNNYRKHKNKYLIKLSFCHPPANSRNQEDD